VMGNGARFETPAAVIAIPHVRTRSHKGSRTADPGNKVLSVLSLHRGLSKCGVLSSGCTDHWPPQADYLPPLSEIHQS
jgi:hypothetical protein